MAGDRPPPRLTAAPGRVLLCSLQKLHSFLTASLLHEQEGVFQEHSWNQVMVELDLVFTIKKNLKTG